MLYGDSFYGLNTYGGSKRVDFNVDPLAAVPFGYNAVRITWASPTGGWDRLRLIQSRTGFATDETDGLILVDATGAVSDYLDTGLLDGTWYYYTILVHSGNEWNVVGTTSALSVGRTGLADLLWSRIPRWFRYEPSDPSATRTPTWEQTAEIIDPNSTWTVNQTLKDFIGVLGWGLDYLRTYQDTLLWANDTRQAHLANVYHLSQTLGETWEPRSPARLMRKKVENAGVLAQKRGTLDGLQELVTSSLGYDVELSIGPNMFLNEDQSGFAHPQYPEWDSATNYAVGDLVTWVGGIWRCIHGAYGLAQSPPVNYVVGNPAANTWWTIANSVAVETTRNAATQAIVTWKSWVGSTFKPAYLAYGVSDPLDQLDNASNALWIRNTDATTQSYTVVGAANPTIADAVYPYPDAAVRHGIPLPRLLPWDPDTEYDDGDYATLQDISYVALRDNAGRSPDASPLDWKRIGYDERLPLKFSFWTHGGFTSVDGTTGVIPVSGSLRFYDGQGKALPTTTTPSTVPVIDTFNSGLHDLLSHRSFDVSPQAMTWSAVSGRWLAVPTDDGNAVAWASAPGTVLTTGPAQTTYNVAVTFGAAPVIGTQSLVVCAASNAATYVAIERGAIKQYSNGSVTASSNLSTPIKDGDRVVATVDATAKTVSVAVNGAARGSLTFTITHYNTYGLHIG